MGCLYKISFPNGKSYIGITSKTAVERVAVHNYRRNAGEYAICKAFKKYGIANITTKTLVIADDWEYLCDLERKAIIAFDTKSPNGYNMTDGGEVPIGLTKESLNKIGAAAKGNQYNLGKKRTIESKLKMSQSAKAKPPMSLETRLKIGLASKGNKYSLGRVMNEEEKINRSLSARCKYHGNSSGIVGVSFDMQTQKWRATITIKRRTINLGRFQNIEDAKAARLAGEKLYYEH